MEKAIQKEFQITIESTVQLHRIAKYVRRHLGAPEGAHFEQNAQEHGNWRIRKLREDGTKNTGKRCKIASQLRNKPNVTIIIEVFKDSDKIVEADLLLSKLQ